MNKRVMALFVMALVSIKVQASDVLIYDYRAGYVGNQPDTIGADGLAGRQIAAGNTPTIINISTSYSTYAPTNLSDYAQVWDLGATRGITSSQQSAYLSYLQAGGTLFLMGENTTYPTRNNALTSFIGSYLGGGALSIVSSSGQETVAPAFQLANNNSLVEFAGSGRYQSIGTGVCITSNCSAVAWGVGTLTNALKGTVISVLDVDFLKQVYLDVTTQGPGYGNQDFVDNLIAYLVQQAQLANGPSVVDTLASFDPNIAGLRGVFNLQSAIINTGLTYDCTTFDKNGVCASAGGRYTSADSPSTNVSGALLIAAYRSSDNVRVGAYLDQNLSTENRSGVHLDNNNPMGGVFGVWNQNADGTGYEVRLAAGYSDKDVTISRSAVGSSEAGKGDSSIKAAALSAIISRGIELNNTRWIASPYIGVRYTKIKRNGYTEGLTAEVQHPLAYAGLSQETTSALVGVRLNGRLGERTYLMASVGVENDVSHNTDNYEATGVANLTSVTFNDNIKHIRPVASAGISYAIDRRQTIGVQASYRQEAFQSSGSASALATYQVGF